MLKVIFVIMAIGMICEIQLLLRLIFTYLFFIAMKFRNAKKMNCALMLNISNYNGIKSCSNTLQLEPCNVMLKVISDIMEHWYVLWNSIVIAINLCNGKKMICALMLIIKNNHNEIKCISNPLLLEPCNVLFNIISGTLVCYVKFNWYWN